MWTHPSLVQHLSVDSSAPLGSFFCSWLRFAVKAFDCYSLPARFVVLTVDFFNSLKQGVGMMR